MKKTVLKSLIVSAFVAILFTLSANAQNTKYVIDTQGGFPGDNVVVDILLENSPGFGGIAYEVVYDNELLSVVDYKKVLGEEISTDSGIDRLKDRIVFQYAGIRNIQGDGVLVSITFRINENAPEGEAEISVVHEKGSSFYYGGEKMYTEIDFDIENAVGAVKILSNNKNDKPIDKEPSDDREPTDDKESSDDEEPAINEEPSEEEPTEEPIEDTNKENNDTMQEYWENPFTDVKENDWFYEAVKNANIKGIINGVTDTEFAPNQKVTRAMFATMLFRLEVLPRVRMHNFSDVPFGAWYYNAVAWASEEGIVNGITPTEFAPDVGVTREQLATMLFRYAQYKGLNAITLEENLEGFEDAHDISEYAVTALNWAVGQGLINGTTPTTLSPLSTATRAQVAVILDRYFKLIQNIQQ